MLLIIILSVIALLLLIGGIWLSGRKNSENNTPPPVQTEPTPNHPFYAQNGFNNKAFLEGIKKEKLIELYTDEPTAQDIYEALEYFKSYEGVVCPSVSLSSYFLEAVHYFITAHNNLRLAYICLKIGERTDYYSPLHFAYQRLAEEYYKRRDIDDTALESCIELCKNDINILPYFFIQQESYRAPKVLTLDRLAIIYERQGRINDALEVSKIGNLLPVSNEFENRIDRLNKKVNPGDLSTGNIGLDYSSEDLASNESLIELVNFLEFFKESIYVKHKTLENTYCVIDVETTGLSPEQDEIIELGAVKVIDNNIASQFVEYVKPAYPIPSEITEINGITNEMVENAKPIRAVLPRFLKFIDGFVLVGHNVNFDMRFILKHDKELYPQKVFKTIDTLPLARKYIQTDNYQLSTLKEYLGVEEISHRALSDCITTNSVYQYCKQKSEVQSK